MENDKCQPSSWYDGNAACQVNADCGSVLIQHVLQRIETMKNDIMASSAPARPCVDFFREEYIGTDFMDAFGNFGINIDPEREDTVCSIVAALKCLFLSFPRETHRAKRIRTICTDIGNSMNLTNKEQGLLVKLCYLNNIGCLGITPDCWKNWGSFSSYDIAEIKLHPQIGYEVALAIGGGIDLAECVLMHHEHWDGSGYPRGIKKTAIKLPCRIFSVASSLDALIESGMDRRDVSITEILKTIRFGAGTLFDPEIVESFFDMLYIQPPQHFGSSLIDVLISNIK